MQDLVARPATARPPGRSWVFAAVLVLGAGAAARPARAQEEALFTEVPSVTGASRYEQDPREAPASITVVTQDDIRRYGYRTLGDVLNNVRGLFTTYDRNYTYVAVRGFTLPGDYNTHILMLVDGHRVNDNVVDAARVGTESPVDMTIVDRIEVIRGPASSLYGTNAFYAVINIVTRQGRQLQGGEVSADGGTFGSYRARAMYGRKLAGGLEVLAAGGFYNSSGPNLFFNEFAGTNNGQANGLDGDRTGDGFFKVIYHDWSVEGGVQGRRKNIPTASFGTTFADPREETWDGHGFVFARYEHTFSQLSRVSVKVGYDRFRYSGSYPYPEGLSRDYIEGDWASVEAQYMQPIGSRNKLIVGGELRANVRQNQGVFNESPYAVFLDDQRESQVGAGFVQDEFRISRSLLLNAGLRYDHYESFGGTVNPRAALIYSVDRSTTLKALYGRAFRAPTFYELFYADDGQTQEASPGLRPETISSLEFTAERQWSSRLRTTMSLYHFGANDLIRLTTDSATGLLVFENLNRVTANGVELEAETNFGPVEARASYALSEVRDPDADARPVNAPTHLVRLAASVPLMQDRLRVSGDGRYMSSRLALAGPDSPAFAVFDVTVIGRPFKNGPQLIGSVYNIFNNRYSDPGGEELEQHLVVQDGRVIRVGARYQF